MAIRNMVLALTCISLIFPRLHAQTSTAPASATPPTAATPPAASTVSPASAEAVAPTACAAAFGIFGQINSSSSSASGTSGGASTPPPATVSVTNNAAPPGSPTPATNPQAGSASSKGGTAAAAASQTKPKSDEGLTGIYDLAKPKLSAAESAADPAPKKVPILINASDVATALQGKIPGVTSLVPIGPSAILYTIDPSKASSAPPHLNQLRAQKGKKPVLETPAQAIEDQLILAFDALPSATITAKVLNLPDGYLGACSIIAMVGHQVPGILSLAALSDTRILVGVQSPVGPEDAKPGTPETDPFATLKDLVEKLAVSSSPPAPPVQSVTMRLYYDRDAVSVASVVQNAFAQLKVQSVSMNPTFTYRDAIVIADPTGTGSVDALDQARRMVAQLDEPRAQVAVNAWSLQISRDQKDKSSELVSQARRLAGGYNDALEASVIRGWRYVNKLSSATVNDDSTNMLSMDPIFASYLCNSYTYNAVTKASETKSDQTGLCPAGTGLSYALGYNTLFGQEDPDLIQMLILAMATTNPNTAIMNTVNNMEDHDDYTFKKIGLDDVATIPRAASEKQPGDYRSCQEFDKEFYLRQNDYLQKAKQTDAAARKDASEDTEGHFYKNAEAQVAPLFVAFNCTRAKLNSLTRPDGSISSSSFVGQFRAAVADYLFQNKMKAEYPNNFEPFLYPASAATLDAVLTPVVEAFNQDLEALQQNLQQQLTYKVPQDKHLHYSSNGLVSVKVVSGNQAMVQTQSLNYFPQNPTLSLENFAKNLASAQAPPAAATAPLPASILAGSLSSVVATMGAYAASLPQQVTAKVGSGLALTVTPFTLSSAKGAELNVNVTYNENGAATISNDQTQNNATDDLNSRVSEHEVSTLVRMDSLKFFEISTLQSVTARQQKPWKPIDPFFELPLLDNPGIIIARRKPKVIYSQSIIFMEASIMPTAADLGQGLIYQSDTIAQGICPKPSQTGPTQLAHVAHSDKDFCFDENKDPNPLLAIMDYHKKMVGYFAGQYVDSSGTVFVRKGVELPTIPSAH